MSDGNRPVFSVGKDMIRDGTFLLLKTDPINSMGCRFSII